MSNSNLKIEEMSNEPMIVHKSHSALSQRLIESEPGTWIKVTGFENKTQMVHMVQSMRSGSRSISNLLKQSGFYLSVKTDRQNLIVYVCKKPDIEKRIIADGIANPLEARDATHLLKSIIATIKKSAIVRGDEKVIASLEGDIDEIVKKIVEARKV